MLAHFRFYAELNDHLPPHRRYRTLEREFLVPTPVKDLIEAFQVPHTEVDLVLINGESADFTRLVQNGDRVSVYPVFEALDITPVLRVRPEPLREPRFVCDPPLSRLAAYLRMLGFDAECRTWTPGEKHILLTRNRDLLKHSAVTHGYWLRENDGRAQTAEVVRRFDLARRIRPFTRCMVCNERLILAAEKELCHCPRCGRAYWEGSHYQRMRRWIAELTAITG